MTDEAKKLLREAAERIKNLLALSDPVANMYDGGTTRALSRALLPKIYTELSRPEPAAQETVSDEFVLVPRNPTKEMLSAGERADPFPPNADDDVYRWERGAYMAMIAAAPPQAPSDALDAADAAKWRAYVASRS
jgi:hypothetical protein